MEDFFWLARCGVEGVKGLKSPTCCSLMIHWFFVRRPSTRLQFYAGCLCGLRLS